MWYAGFCVLNTNKHYNSGNVRNVAKGIKTGVKMIVVKFRAKENR